VGRRKRRRGGEGEGKGLFPKYIESCDHYSNHVLRKRNDCGKGKKGKREEEKERKGEENRPF